VQTWQTTEAGRHFRTPLEGVRRGRWQLVGASGRVEAVLADAEEISDLLGAAYCFRPKTAFGGHGAEIWLHEVGAHVVGATRDEAGRKLGEGIATTFARRRPRSMARSRDAGWARDRPAQVRDARSTAHEPE